MISQGLTARPVDCLLALFTGKLMSLEHLTLGTLKEFSIFFLSGIARFLFFLLCIIQSDSNSGNFHGRV